eukprot:TRINITY_DN1364_c0_g1_i2.p1 TRINITY_DN1364_c0_g1~~TRINITY_DN1364_c0_g1_i2.p1  ORF type:complete len:139 (-),score=12.21 TRINITY_DN1364_c0_g1_i2:226-642(-)
MGNSIANSIAEKQKEMQKDMAKVQMENMERGQERQRRMMMAMAIAQTRDLLKWQEGVGVLGGLALGAFALKHRRIPGPAMAPVAVWLVTYLYQYDLAYGSKPGRINKTFQEITTDENNWFVPLMPPPSSATKSTPPSS